MPKRFALNSTDLSEDEVRPYFSLDNVLQGAFTVAGRLFNIDFVERTDMPIYHPDVRVFEVQQMGTQEVIGILYVDYFARSSKRGGAWMSSFRFSTKWMATKSRLSSMSVTFHHRPRMRHRCCLRVTWLCSMNWGMHYMDCCLRYNVNLVWNQRGDGLRGVSFSVDGRWGKDPCGSGIRPSL